MNPIILPLSDPQATLDMVGGKGMSLAKLANAGLPVPGGFHITTEAYRQFVHTNNLQDGIQEALHHVDASLPSSFETASRTISARFADATIPAELANAIVSAYHNLPGSNPPVAVRSSATAEDLPEASFAGQQDTYLNISGVDHVLEATQKCWASLWTARAIAYRLRQNIPSGNVALAVVVQLLVNAEAAGILFTANPLNGNHAEMVINAAWGLGEAVVSGAVTPDTITIRKPDGKLLSRETVEKLVMTVRLVSGTQEQPVPDPLKKVPVLSDEQAAALGRYGAHIEKLYGIPMDIEWTLADGEFAILQARPITTLGESPLEWKPPTPKGIYMRTSVVDLMPDPLSPLFVSMGIPALTAQMYPLGRMLTHTQPILPPDYYTTINSYAYLNAKFPVRGWLWLIFGLIPAYPRLLRLSVPLFRRDEALPQYQKIVTSFQEKAYQQMTNHELWQETQSMMNAAAYYTSTLLFATMGASAGSEALLTKVYDKLAKRPGDPPATSLLMGWNNIPSRAEKSLYDLALFCQERQSLALAVLETPSSELVSGLGSDRIPQGVESADWLEFLQYFERHLQDFGYLIFDLDFAKPLPA